jgi:hypothetical protein
MPDTMTPAQYVEAIAALGFEGYGRHVGAAELIGTNVSTSRRWEDGDRAVPAPVARWLRYMVACELKPHKVIAVIEAATPRRRAAAPRPSAKRGAVRRAAPSRSGSARPAQRYAAH